MEGLFKQNHVGLPEKKLKAKPSRPTDDAKTWPRHNLKPIRQNGRETPVFTLLYYFI